MVDNRQGMVAIGSQQHPHGKDIWERDLYEDEKKMCGGMLQNWDEQAASNSTTFLSLLDYGQDCNTTSTSKEYYLAYSMR